MGNECIWTELCIPVNLLKAYEIQINDFPETEEDPGMREGQKVNGSSRLHYG